MLPFYVACWGGMENSGIRSEGKSLLAFVESKVHALSKSKVDEVVRAFIESNQDYSYDDWEPVNIDEIEFEESKGDELSEVSHEGSSTSAFIQGVEKTRDIAELISVIEKADASIQEQLFLESQTLDAQELVQLLEKESELANLPLLAVAAPTLGKVVEKRKALQSEQSSENRPAEEISDYIGNGDQPGPFIQSLRGLRESFVSLYQAASGKQELPSEEESITALRSNSTSRSEKEAYARAFQAHSAKGIEKCMLENTKLLLFADNEDERRKEYKKFASMLYKIIGPSEDDSRQSRIENAFAIGEGSLCELPSVCKTGWEQRIKAFLPWQSSGDKGDLSSFVLDICNLEKRFFISGLLQHQFQSDVHYTKEGLRICNEVFALGITDEELGDLESATHEFVSANINRESFKYFFEANFTFDGVKQRLREQFDQLGGEDKQHFIDTLTELYGQSLREDEGHLIDEMLDVRKACEQAKKDNRNIDPKTRSAALVRRRTEFTTIFGKPILSLLPMRVQAAIDRVMKALRTACPSKMRGFNISPDHKAIPELRDQCNKLLSDITIDEEKKKIVQGQKDALSDILPENTNIEEIDPDELEIAFLQEHQKEVEEALEQRVPGRIRDNNVQTFRQALTYGTSENLRLSKAGATMLLLAAGLCRAKSEDGRELNLLSDSLLLAEIEKIGIKDGNEARALLQNDPSGITQCAKEVINESFLEELMQGYSPEQTIELFRFLPARYQSKALAVKALEKCQERGGAFADPSISMLYRHFKESIKLDREIVALSFTKTLENHFSLYKALPEGIKKETHIIELVLGNLQEGEAAQLMKELPSELKESWDANFESIFATVFEKCEHDEFGMIFEALPDHMQTGDMFKSCVRIAFQNCVSNGFDALTSALRPVFKSDIGFMKELAGTALNNCNCDQVPAVMASLFIGLEGRSDPSHQEDLKPIVASALERTIAPANAFIEYLSTTAYDAPFFFDLAVTALDQCNGEDVLPLLRALDKTTALKMVHEMDEPVLKEKLKEFGELFCQDHVQKSLLESIARSTSCMDDVIGALPEFFRQRPQFQAIAQKALDLCKPQDLLNLMDLLGESGNKELIYKKAKADLSDASSGRIAYLFGVYCILLEDQPDRIKELLIDLVENGNEDHGQLLLALPKTIREKEGFAEEYSEVFDSMLDKISSIDKCILIPLLAVYVSKDDLHGFIDRLIDRFSERKSALVSYLISHLATEPLKGLLGKFEGMVLDKAFTGNPIDVVRSLRDRDSLNKEFLIRSLEEDVFGDNRYLILQFVPNKLKVDIDVARALLSSVDYSTAVQYYRNLDDELKKEPAIIAQLLDKTAVFSRDQKNLLIELLPLNNERKIDEGNKQILIEAIREYASIHNGNGFEETGDSLKSLLFNLPGVLKKDAEIGRAALENCDYAIDSLYTTRWIAEDVMKDPDVIKMVLGKCNSLVELENVEERINDEILKNEDVKEWIDNRRDELTNLAQGA